MSSPFSPPRPLLLCLLAAIGTPVVACKEASKAHRAATEPKSREVHPPQPPFAYVHGMTSASAGALTKVPGDEAFRDCPTNYRSWPEGASGGPYSLTYCYAKTDDLCLALNATALPRVLGLAGGPKGTCIFSEDHAHEDADPKTGQKRCCYNTWQMGIGRPMLVQRETRVAPLRAVAWC